jgi:hypothetical protein
MSAPDSSDDFRAKPTLESPEIGEIDSGRVKTLNLTQENRVQACLTYLTRLYRIFLGATLAAHAETVHGIVNAVCT